jgi:hypothetical protein
MSAPDLPESESKLSNVRRKYWALLMCAPGKGIRLRLEVPNWGDLKSEKPEKCNQAEQRLRSFEWA